MKYPESVVTRPVEAGGALSITDGRGLEIRAVTVASRPLIHLATGIRLEKTTRTQSSPLNGESLWWEAVATDQSGAFVDPLDGNKVIVLAEGEHTHTYTTTLTIRDGATTIGEYVIGPYTVPAGATVIDIDLLQVTDVTSGTAVPIPESWSQIVANAEAATVDALAARELVDEGLAELEPSLTDIADLKTKTTTGYLGEGKVAPLVSGKLPEANVPDRLTEPALSATFASSAPSRLIATMRRGIEDATLGVLGDSTGNETTEWIYRLLTWLGTVFPAWTIVWRVWDDATQAYLAPVTIQTGTGARKLTVYNGSHPGAASNYPYENSNATRFGKMLPVEPTAVILSFGYNSGLAYYRDAIIDVSRWVLGYFPKTELIAVAQPPKGNADADQANSLKRFRDVRDVALANGWGLIDAAQAFLDHGNFTADLISVDGIHPNAAGSQVWADAAKRYFMPTAGTAIQRTPTPNVERLFIPAQAFRTTLLSGGVCEMGQTPANVPAYRFSSDHLNIIATVADVPANWASVNVYALWTTAGGSTNAVVFYVDWMKLTDGVAVPISGFTPAGFTTGTKQTVNSQATVTSRATKVYTREAFAGGRPLVFRVRRDGADAGDTTSVEWLFYGLMVERAE